jgi:hypothetical protein
MVAHLEARAVTGLGTVDLLRMGLICQVRSPSSCSYGAVIRMQQFIFNFSY